MTPSYRDARTHLKIGIYAQAWVACIWSCFKYSIGSSANMFGSESDLTIEYSASSEWSSSYDAGHAAEGEGAYWCSDGGDEAPLYWWISFKERPVEIVTITFEEKYPGALFEFFGSSTEECAEKGTALISGNQADIDNRQFTNGRSYYCYGLKITKLAETSSYGRLASLTKFDFQYKGSLPKLDSSLVCF